MYVLFLFLSCLSHILSVSLVFTWICDACKSIVITWLHPATVNMFATSFAEIGARLCENTPNHNPKGKKKEEIKK